MLDVTGRPNAKTNARTHRLDLGFKFEVLSIYTCTRLGIQRLWGLEV